MVERCQRTTERWIERRPNIKGSVAKWMAPLHSIDDLSGKALLTAIECEGVVGIYDVSERVAGVGVVQVTGAQDYDWPIREPNILVHRAVGAYWSARVAPHTMMNMGAAPFSGQGGAAGLRAAKQKLRPLRHLGINVLPASSMSKEDHDAVKEALRGPGDTTREPRHPSMTKARLQTTFQWGE